MNGHAAADKDEANCGMHHSLREQMGQLVDRERVLCSENDQLRAQLVEMKEQEKKKYDDLMVQYNMKREYEDGTLTNQVTVKTESDDEDVKVEIKQEIKEEYNEDHDIFIKREYVPVYIKTESDDEDVKDIIKQEIKEEYNEDHDDDCGFDLRLVKKELVSDDDDNSMQIDEVIPPNLAVPKDILSRDQVNRPMQSVFELSPSANCQMQLTNSSQIEQSVDQQVDKADHEPNEPANHGHMMDESEVGDNVATVESANNLGENEICTEEHVNGLDTNVPPPSTVNDINSSTSDNEQVNYLSTVEPIPSAVYSSKDVPTSSSIIDMNIKTEDASNSQQSVQMCKRVKMEQDAQYITDSDCDHGSDDCIVKQEIKEEFDETWQLDPDNGQSVQIWTQVKTEVKEEVESEEENIIGFEDGAELNHNQNEYLHESSNGRYQGSVNGQQVDKGDHGPSEPANDGQNISPTSKQAKTRKRRRVVKSLVTENSSFENSLTSGEVSSPTPMTSSKRTRVSSSLDRRTNADQMSPQSKVDLSDGDDRNGIDSSGEGEKGVGQSEDEETWLHTETELGDDEDEGGNYSIRTIKLKCTEDGCNAEVSNRVELHRHLQIKHLTSSPHRCLAEGCSERFEQWGWDGLGKHVQDNHSNISTWSCPHCTKAFKSQNCLYKHLHLYHFEGQFKCGYDGCHYDRVATLRSEILSHQRSVHPKTFIYTCQFNSCGKLFNHKGTFNRHQLVHTGVKPFPCDWIGCGKSFTRKGQLDVHQRMHQKVKPFKCTWNMCDYAATQQSNVITHIRTQHFGLPKSQKEQRQLGIEDNRNPRDYLLNTTKPILPQFHL